ncbi:MAG: type IV pilus assembly protein PilM, partial [Firmicutes bacterium]|nr:type IV pilus assembly protein PilM [Bacillota bacterium]
MFNTARRAVGLEIDTGAARVVELAGSAAHPKLATLGGIILPPGAVEEGMILQPEEVARALRTLWEAREIKSREVLLGISNQGVLVRSAVIPKVPADKLDNVVRFHAQEYLPIPLASVVLDYLVIGETANESGEALEVLLVAAQREMLESFLETLYLAGLEARDIDVSSLILARTLPAEAASSTAAVVNAANGLSSILITTRGRPRLARLVPVKLKEIADGLGCLLEDLLPALSNLGPEHETPLPGWFDELAAEIRSSINYYQSQEGAAEVEVIYLNGRGARLPGIFEALEEKLGLPVHKVNPLQAYLTPAFAQLATHGEAMEYAISAGLAHRALEGEGE